MILWFAWLARLRLLSGHAFFYSPIYGMLIACEGGHGSTCYLRGETLNYRSRAVAKGLLKTVF